MTSTTATTRIAVECLLAKLSASTMSVFASLTIDGFVVFSDMVASPVSAVVPIRNVIGDQKTVIDDRRESRKSRQCTGENREDSTDGACMNTGIDGEFGRKDRVVTLVAEEGSEHHGGSNFLIVNHETTATFFRASSPQISHTDAM